MNRSLFSFQARTADRPLWMRTLRLVGSLLAGALLLLPVLASAQTEPVVQPVGPQAAPQAEYQCFYALADTYADSDLPDSNFGGDTTLHVLAADAGARLQQTYLRFGLSAIPSDSTILSASLKLYLTQDASTGAYQLWRATSPWQEYNLTWNNRPTLVGYYDNPTHSGSPGWKTWNAVQPVSDWVSGAFANYGFVISSGLLDAPALFASRDGSYQQQPELCVTWTTGAQTDLQATGLEVTQAVQDLNNSVRLVAGKRTFVRLHADSSQDAWRTFASLAVTCDDFGQVLYPVNPGTNGLIVIGENPDRGVLEESFLFELPSECTDEPEQISLSGLVNPTTSWRGEYPPEDNLTNNATGEFFLTFESAPQFDTIVYLADYYYRNNGGFTSVSTDESHAYMLQSWLERAYPIPGSWLLIRRIDFEEIKTKIKDGSTVITNPKAGKFNRKLAAKRRWDLSHNNWYEGMVGSEREIRYYGMIDDEGGFMRGRAMSKKPVSSGPTGPTGGTSFTWDTDGSWGDWYGGHEIGHTLDRRHARCSGDEKGWDRDFPHPDGLISTARTGDDALYGFDYGNLPDGIYGPRWSDVMSYCVNQWISDHTTHGILDELQSNVTLAAVPSPAAGDHLLVVGSIEVVSDTAELEPLFVLADPIDVEAPVPGEYDIILQDGSGGELARYPFTPEPMDPGPPLPGAWDDARHELLISEMVPFVSGTDRVVIEGPTGVLTDVSAGPSAPSITVLSPNGGESLSGDLVDVSWAASDPDGDELSFSIDYSPDSGATWELVVYGITGNSYAVPRQNILSTSGQGRFRVWASDGIHASSDTSDAGFTVTTRQPDLIIVSPEDGLVIAQQQTLSLQALAYSDRTGLLDGDQPRWVSNLDGLIATGNNTSVTGLSEGTHTFIVSADDGERTAFATFQVIVVADPSLLPVPEDELWAAPAAVALHPHLGATSAQIRLGNASGTKPLNWQSVELTPWLSLNKTAGTTPDQVTISVDASGLEPGDYSANVGFLTEDIPGGSPESVNVAFIIPADRFTIYLPMLLR
jgi:hypothetical protein